MEEVLSVLVSVQWKGIASVKTSREHHLCLTDTSRSGNGLFSFAGLFAELGCVESVSLPFANVQFLVLFSSFPSICSGGFLFRDDRI